MVLRGKYEATGPEAEFEPGSRGRVLRNLLGITATTHRWPRCSRALSSGRGDATLPMGDERFRAGRNVTALALGERRADAFDRRGRLRRDAQGRLTGRSRFEVGVGLLESHTRIIRQ